MVEACSTPHQESKDHTSGHCKYQVMRTAAKQRHFKRECHTQQQFLHEKRTILCLASDFHGYIRGRIASPVMHSKREITTDNIMNHLAILSCVAVCVCVGLVSAARVELVPVYDQVVDESSFVPQVIPRSASDLETAASGHGHYGRVQIKVYRGPTTHGHHEHFAPHGFWVKQPADDHH
ncbi:uncharacterized protein LOC124619290 [Schistocerca americana]|nr:uncharacterized protein LOC124619290 [Schistocerca americana]XP_049939562.1 uncharacterized protein LOC126416104 [Schistocerca serialis cubense]